MTAEAHAKVNIGLRVGRKRPDGFHDIDTYMARISLADELDISIRASDAFSCRISGNEGYIRKGEEDLMEKGARMFSAAAGIPFSLDIAIRKHIPVQGGLGGGSSDAATVLLALERHFQSGLDLIRLGAEVSSDVPFFVSGYPFAHVTGRGEVVEPSIGPDGFPVTLAMPGRKVPTPGAFSLLDAIGRDSRPLPPLGRGIPSKADYPNDFELLEDNKCPFKAIDRCFASLSGSGSVWYVISDEGIEKLLDFPEYCVIYKAGFV